MRTSVLGLDPRRNRFETKGGVFMRTPQALLTALLLLSTTLPCAGTQVDENTWQSQKADRRENKDADKAIREAIRLGHIVPGMDRGQVTAALGEPIRKIHSSKTTGMEHWLYRMAKLHQEELRGRGWSFVRITFLEGRVIMLNPR